MALDFNAATAVSRGSLRGPPGPDELRPADFNAATAVSRGSRGGDDLLDPRGVRLQCGHGCEPWVTSNRRRPSSTRS